MSEERDALPGDGQTDDIDDIDLGEIDADGQPIEPDEPDPTDEPDPEPSPEPDPAAERRNAARRGQVHRVRAELDRERAQNADLVRRIAALEARPAQPPPDPQAQQREENEFRQSLENMLPHEAALAVAARSERRMQAQLAQVALQGFDRGDTADWRRLQTTNRAAARHAPEVERVLQQRRAMGDYTLGRRDILAYLVGQEVLSRPEAAPRPRTPRTPRPASGRGDVAGTPGGQRRDQAAADIATLRGITTADI
jgi:hypothetical protein